MPKRLASIDVFRALTMFFMIFVNDLWTLNHIPSWLDHVDADVDGLGFADTIFPAFLFIVGLSLPLAIKNREKAGDSRALIFYHVCIRSFSLITIGFFQVNMEEYSRLAILNRTVFSLLLTLSFFLIWLDYPKDLKKYYKILGQFSGIILLIVLAFLYKGGDRHHIIGLKPYWWGILGLIGWSYLLCSTVYVVFKGNIWAIFLSFIFLISFCILDHLDMLDFLDTIHKYFWLIGEGAEPALVMAGVILSLIYSRLSQKNHEYRMIWVLMASALAVAAFGFFIRPIGGISKIYDTPSWVCISLSISLVVYAFIIYLVDIKQKKDWFRIILPAGTSTLTCYLMPYIYYGLFSLALANPWKLHIRLPLILRTGVPGLIKSMLFSLLIITLVGWLEKRKLRLKL